MYGIDLADQTITISNAYGYSEKITLLEFQNRMLYTDINQYPGNLRNVIEKGEIDKNAILIIKRTG